jgi:hypothetical protein
MTDPGIRTESFNPGDSIFPFYNQCNAVQALTGKTVTRGYFSPETRFGFHLEKCHPIDQAVEQLLNQDSQLFGGTLAVIPLSTGATKHTEATDRVKGIILEIIDIKLTYESFTPESLTGSPRQSVFYVDVPQVIVAELTPDVNVTDVTFTLPPGTKVVYIVYAHQEQLWHDAVSGKNTSCRFMFPKTLAKVTVDLEGREDLLIKRGLVGPGKKGACLQWSNLKYYDWLFASGLYPGELEEMFMRGDNPANYQQCLIFPALDYKIDSDKGTVLTLHQEFGGAGNLSPKGVNVVAFCVSQYTYSVNKNRNWTATLIK